MLPNDDLTLEELGAGWEETERALADVQADLSRTVADAPKLILLWRNADPERGSDELDAPDERWAYVGKARDWYFGADGGFALPCDYALAVLAIASEVSGAVADTLLGYRDYWPHCPTDDYILEARPGSGGRCWWVCRSGNHTVAEVGHLPAPPS